MAVVNRRRRRRRRRVPCLTALAVGQYIIFLSGCSQ